MEIVCPLVRARGPATLDVLFFEVIVALVSDPPGYVIGAGTRVLRIALTKVLDYSCPAPRGKLVLLSLNR